MTTNDTSYEARLARLENANRGDTVTIPDGWALPAHPDTEAGRYAFVGYRPGAVFTNDGMDDSCPWEDVVGMFQYPRDLAKIGLDVDQADGKPVADVETDVPVGEADEDGWIGPDDDEETADEDKTTVGSVHVRIIPDTDGFVEKIAKVAEEAADAIDAAGFHLDDFQRERVAALEQAVRVLESRRSPRTGNGGGVFSSLFAPGTSVPMVGVQDMVDVAAFIADADTGRTEMSA